MKRSSLTLVLAALFVAVFALPAFAGDRGAVATVERPSPTDDFGLGRLIACLRILDLSPTQQADIQAILDAAKPILQADAKRKIVAVPGIVAVDVELVLDPPWNPSMMSEAAKLQLGML